MQFSVSAVMLSSIFLSVGCFHTTQAGEVAFARTNQSSGCITRQLVPTTHFVRDTIPGDEETSETGILRRVEDAGNSIIVLTIELPKQQLTEQFTINLDDATTIQRPSLQGLLGSQIAFSYTTEVTNALIDIQIDGNSLLDADARLITPMTRQVIGVLGADEITTGDVPGLLLITAADGEVTEFPFIITSDLLEVNGTTVTAFYEERTTKAIKAITLLK